MQSGRLERIVGPGKIVRATPKDLSVMKVETPLHQANLMWVHGIIYTFRIAVSRALGFFLRARLTHHHISQ